MRSAISFHSPAVAAQAQAKRGYAGLDGGPFVGGSTFGGGRKDVGEWLKVVAGADSALGAGLQRCRAAALKRVEDDVAGPGVAGDEGVDQAGRESWPG